MSNTDSDSYEGSLNRDAQRGVQTVTYKVPGDRPDEICVLPPHLPFAKYRGKDGAKDIADEKKLAGYDFYRSGTAESGAVATLPKRTSTSAAVDVYELPPGTSRPETLTADYCTQLEKTGKCAAKFKQTDNQFTTTSTAAVLGYYHVARALGDICEIKPAVLRTMDIGQHKKIVRLASEMGVHGTVGKSWELFNRYYADPKGSAVAHTLFTSDFTQIYGALLDNTTGEENYSEWLSVGSNLSDAHSFRQMADSRPATSILGSRDFTQSNVQTLVAMRDMSEMILLDYLLAQSDRLTGGNISNYQFAYYKDGDQMKSVKASNIAGIPADAPKVVVKKLTIKDTDAGLLNTNLFEQKGYVSMISHMHPDTFDRLQTFAQKWESDPSVKEFFHRECTFSNSQIGRFEKYLHNAASALQSRKASGKLLLDLDLDEYFQGIQPTPAAAPAIADSVGRWEKGAKNSQDDVKTVQGLLEAAARALKAAEINPKGVDGAIAHPPAASNTVAAIEAFQTRSGITADGFVAPDGATWSALVKATGTT